MATATDIVEVKTKAAAEKALAAGKSINIIAGSFALVLSSCNATIIVSGDACPRIVTRETSAPRIETWGTSAPRIVTRETSAPRIVTRETSAPSIETWETSAPRIETWGTSAPSIVTRGTSAPSIVTRETSAPSIVTRETSAPRIETWGTSAPSIVTRETSAPSIDANGYSMIRVRGRVVGKASPNVSLHLQGEIEIEGGKQTLIVLKTPADWCDYYGVRIEDGCAVVYKAVGDGYRSEWGAVYTPGTMPSDPKWNGRKRECSAGGGLNFSPTPRHTHRFVSNPKHYLECRIRLDDDFAVHFDGKYPEKCCHKEVAAPLVEVDVDGNPIKAPAEQVQA